MESCTFAHEAVQVRGWKVVHSPTRLFKCEAGKLYIRPGTLLREFYLLNRECQKARIETWKEAIHSL